MPRSHDRFPDDPYEPVWGRLAERLEREIAEYEAERGAAAALADEWLSLEPAERKAAAREEARFQTVALVQELTRRGQAGPALELIGHLPAGRPQGLIANLRAEAWGTLAENHLANGRLDRTERALNQAAQALRDSPDSEAHGHFCRQMAG